MSIQPGVWQEKDNADNLSAGANQAIGNALTFDSNAEGAFYVEVLVLVRTAGGVTLRFNRGVTGNVASNGNVAIEDVTDTVGTFVGGLLTGWAVTFSVPAGRQLQPQITVPVGQTAASVCYVATCHAQAV